MAYEGAMKKGGEKRYKIGQAAKLLELESYVLRFWESEFPQLDPIRTPTGQRLYTERHLQLLRRIKFLLYEEGMTIDGARRRLEDTDRYTNVLEEVTAELQDLRDYLANGPAGR
ncbi:MerR family transcriptional regulator [Desulfohalobium retbaense]|uniref:Transcriptional regulator, MerR family n=1 Tax=Desulfohalobium retbaense (strain ATCC 49708 / DSM 5692 / JCM 16813 / HR100) TaxID=485915 RepID=C8WZ78_DESRD|nr:MerR family transcriptional regulator [Desulfohalobium retbaense]ACV67353.1 transcriptional regulator, MerR family [Desulfohalobium retbaense DSM 5692]